MLSENDTYQGEIIEKYCKRVHIYSENNTIDVLTDRNLKNCNFGKLKNLNTVTVLANLSHDSVLAISYGILKEKESFLYSIKTLQCT